MKSAEPGRAADDPRQCPQCDTELREAILGGQCPVCMVKAMQRAGSDDAQASGPAVSSAPGTPQSATELGALRYFGDYELLSEIGRGGMGVVYRARQLSLNRTVALKVIAPDQLASPKAIERFHTEAESAAHLDHPNIVPIYETSEREGRHYFSMKLIEGQSLAEKSSEFRVGSSASGRLISNSDLELRNARLAVMLAKVASAVHYAHQRGILHRDLKPGNILIDASGEPHVADFGLAKQFQLESSLTVSGEVLGTPVYMAPEQAAGNARQVTMAADVYSLGVILYEQLTGQPPFRGQTAVETLHAVLHHEPPRPRTLISGVSRDLETICLKCLEKEPTRRYASAHELADELRRFQRGEPILARAISAPEKIWRWCRRKPALAGSLLMAHLILVVGGVGILWQWRRAESNATEARAKELAARENLYAADINVIQNALATDNFRQALDLLQKQIPKPGEPDLRGFEWRYLWRQCQSDELFSLPGHRTHATSVAFSPNGKLLATGSWDKTAKVWDLSSRRLIATLTNHSTEVYCVTFSPSGDVLATASADQVWLWETKTFRALRLLPKSIGNAKFSPDGKFLVAAMRNGLLLWDTQTWQPVQRLELADFWGHLDRSHWKSGLAFSPEGRCITVVSNDLIRILSVPDLQETATLRNSKLHDRAISFSPDSRKLAAAALGNGVKIWDLTAGQQTMLISGHSDFVFALAFSHDGKRLATASKDHTIKLWDVDSGQLIRALRGHVGQVWDVAYSADGKQLASVSEDGAVKVWDGLAIASDSADLVGILPLGFDLEGSLIVAGKPDLNSKVFTALDAESRQPLHDWKFEGRLGKRFRVFWRAFETGIDDGRTLALLCHLVDSNAPPETGEAAIPKWGELWDLNRRQQLFSFEGRNEWVRSYPLAGYPQFAPEAGLVANCGTGDISLWRFPEGTRKCVLTNVDDVLALSPRGAMATGKRRGNEVKLWILTGENARLCSTMQATNLASANFSPDGRCLAVATDDGLIRLCEVPSGRIKATLTGHKRGHVQVSFSPDNRTLASMSDDRTVRFWHIPTHRELLRLPMPIEEYGGSIVHFSSDGRTLAACHQDALLLTRLWFAPSFAEIAVAEGRDYRAEMGSDPATWLATAKALARHNRHPESLDVFAKVIDYCAVRPEFELLRASALQQRAQLLARSGRYAEAGADNCSALKLPGRDPRAPASLVDLSRYFNKSLDVRRTMPPLPFLNGLPRGIQTLPGANGVAFDVRGAIRLYNSYQGSIDGIPVGQKCRHLHFLHGVGGPREADNRQIAAYVLHYADGKEEKIPILYGVDVRNWVHRNDPSDAVSAKIAWTATNDLNGAIRVFVGTWKNPHPEVEIESVDFVSALTKCEPFLIAVTLEP